MYLIGFKCPDLCMAVSGCHLLPTVEHVLCSLKLEYCHTAESWVVIHVLLDCRQYWWNMLRVELCKVHPKKFIPTVVRHYFHYH